MEKNNSAADQVMWAYEVERKEQLSKEQQTIGNLMEQNKNLVEALNNKELNTPTRIFVKYEALSLKEMKQIYKDKKKKIKWEKKQERKRKRKNAKN